MFGFYPLSFKPVGDSGTSVPASVSVTLPGATSSIGTLSTKLTANPVIDAYYADATGYIGTLTTTGDVSVTLGSVSASTNAGAFTFVFSKTVDGVSANASSGGLVLSGDASRIIVSGAAGGATSSVATVALTAEANHTLAGASATTTVNAPDARAITNVPVTGVASTSASGTATAKGKATFELSAISSTLNNSTLDFQAKAGITLSNVLSSTSAGSISADTESKVFPIGVTALFTAQLADPIGASFDYESVALVYTKARTVFILPYEGYQPDNTIVIPAQNFRVYIEPYRDLPRTIFITN
tara:strand:- start:995 stop:1894 length:900 start_codon:yes stop_codon:yes gene_type:complete